MAQLAQHDGAWKSGDKIQTDTSARVEVDKDDVVKQGTFSMKLDVGQKVAFEGNAANSALAALGITSFGECDDDEPSNKRQKKNPDKEITVRKLCKDVEKKLLDALKENRKNVGNALMFLAEAARARRILVVLHNM